VPFRVIVLVDEVQVSQGINLSEDAFLTGFDDGRVIEPFESLTGYQLITGSSLADPGAISFAENAGFGGGDAGRIAFTRGAGSAPIFGMRAARSQPLLPVIAETDFRALAGLDIGDTFRVYVNRQYVDAELVGSFDYFPGHDPASSEHLLVADLEALQALATTVPGLSDAICANEVWMSFATPGVMNRDGLLAAGLQAEAAFDRRDVRAAQDADPLIAASWEGILFLSFAAVLILTGLGFAVYAALAVQSRSLEFAILRTMGYSSRQVLSLVSFEQLFVIVSGVFVGTFLGFPLGRLMIGYLGVTEEGGDPVPPLVSQVSWAAVLTVYGLLAIVFVATITALAAVYSRLAVHRALRIGEI
ncbi:MAG TPA: ABC transporter permease, partial [Tepidiformaceae bacterium]|nr:ABC transporter permease [Tepidiformaceae bacterium]